MLNKITNFFWNAIGALQHKPKFKFRIEFNIHVDSEAELKRVLRPYKIVHSEQKGVFSWRVDMRSLKSAEQIATGLRLRKIVTFVELVGD